MHLFLKEKKTFTLLIVLYTRHYIRCFAAIPPFVFVCSFQMNYLRNGMVYSVTVSAGYIVTPVVGDK